MFSRFSDSDERLESEVAELHDPLWCHTLYVHENLKVVEDKFFA